MTLHWASSDCSYFQCKSDIASGNASNLVEAATGIFPLVSLNACLDNASAGISIPAMCTNVNCISDNLHSRASDVVLSRLDAFTIGMWSVNAVILLFLIYVMKCSSAATNPHNSALYALYRDSESLNCLEKYPIGLVIPFWICVSIAPTPPLTCGSACGCPTLASTNNWKGKAKSGNAITGLDAIIFRNLYQESDAALGKSPVSLYDLHGWSGLVTFDKGPAIIA